MKYICYSLIVILAACIGGFAYTFFNYYRAPKIRQPYITNHHKDDTIRIAYIGDSWAFMHKEYDNDMIIKAESSLKHPVKVLSFGICGLTSREIYEHIYNDHLMKNFLKQGYDYCFISVGVNDSYKKMGISYYQKSLDGIIQFMLTNKIHPIILDIPDYDIQEAYERQTLSKKILRHISMLINNQPLDCKQNFRNALANLATEKYQKRISIIPYKSWNGIYTKDKDQLYRSDGMHLNTKGYHKLDSVIINQIVKHKLSKSN